VSAIVIGAHAHISYFFNGHISLPAVIEGLYYSVQTVTTVGYGDWIPLRMTRDDPRILAMRTFSIFLMLGGTTFFTVSIGVLTTWYQRL
jgi:hypothetical protein